MEHAIATKQPRKFLGARLSLRRQSRNWLCRCACSLALGAFSFSGPRSEVGAAAAPGCNISAQVMPRFSGRQFAFDELNLTNLAGQTLSVTRLDLLVSDFSLRRNDGQWVRTTNWQAYLRLGTGRSQFSVPGLPSTTYDRVRFHIGLTPELNHANPAQFGAAHPLNPIVNGLHWSWQGGYVFLALEGRWAKVKDGKVDAMENQSGYSFHLATDRQLMTIELPMRLDLSEDSALELTLNVDKIFNSFDLTEETNSTHSRTNDPLALQLRKRIEGAFSVSSVAVQALANSPKTTNHIEMAPDAKPYGFKMSAFFPQPALPADNPLTVQGVELGQQLFFDPVLSINNSQSCASCHAPQRAFSEQKSLSTGAEGKTGTRNAMPLFNLAWKSAYFWDGRANTLREQVLQPIQNPIEMHESLSNVVRKLSLTQEHNGESQQTPRSTNTRVTTNAPNYGRLFEAAFGTPEITSDQIARALEQFLLAQTSYDSKFDRVLRGVEQFTTEEQRGFELFHTEYDPRREQFGADCFHCHGGPLFQSQNFANNGLDASGTDLGRFLVTRKEGDKAKFAVPSLRNVELTGPYMHDGRFATLEEVVEHYTSGVKSSPTLDPNLAKHPVGGVPLSAQDKRALVSFLRTLTDERFGTHGTNLAQE